MAVVLVHGVLGQRHLYWNLFRRRLAEAGHDVHEVSLPLALLGDLRLAARRLADHVAPLARHGRVDLVCHSAGGLAARYYLSHLDGARHVRRLVTMGTPHRGTVLSLVPLPLDVRRQTRPGSDFLAELRDAAGVDVVALWSSIDGIVVPGENAKLDGATNVELRTTHWGYLWRKDVAAAVDAALQAP